MALKAPPPNRCQFQRPLMVGLKNKSKNCNDNWKTTTITKCIIEFYCGFGRIPWITVCNAYEYMLLIFHFYHSLWRDTPEAYENAEPHIFRYCYRYTVGGIEYRIEGNFIEKCHISEHFILPSWEEKSSIFS